jgi:hypothetical protein
MAKDKPYYCAFSVIDEKYSSFECFETLISLSFDGRYLNAKIAFKYRRKTLSSGRLYRSTTYSTAIQWL